MMKYSIFKWDFADKCWFIISALSPCSQNVKSIAYKMLVRPQLEYASEVWSPYTMKCIKKIEQIQRNSCRFIFHEYCRDTDTSLLINRLNLDSLYARRLIQQATMFYKIHYSLVDICPPSYIQHANHISSRTDHPLKYCNKNPLQINAYKYSFFPRSMNIWNRLPCSAVSHVIPSVDNFHKFAILYLHCFSRLSCEMSTRWGQPREGCSVLWALWRNST